MTAIPPSGGWTGRSVPRVEDAALLTGRGRYMDDLPIAPGTLHAAILRSPQAHAIIKRIDVSAALAHPGVACVLTRQVFPPSLGGNVINERMFFYGCYGS